MNKSSWTALIKTLCIGLVFSGHHLAAADSNPANPAAAALEPKPEAAYFAKFQPLKAPVYTGEYLQAGDRLAICGDSITEQKMYSRIIETYLTVATPELGVTVRQYGWGGETAPGFLARMTNDCLRFHPTIATTCYGMNDHGYRAYEPAIGQRYREAMTAIVDAFRNAGARVVLGSAGCVGKNPAWSPDKKSTMEDLNLNLCTLRNLDIGIAEAEGVRFADVFWPMLTGGYEAQQKYGENYAIAGGDGVHPYWAGHLVMAYAFLHEMGLSGEIGTFTVDLGTDQANVSEGHELVGFQDGELRIKSSRYPFCASGDSAKDNSIRSGMTLVPFNQELNRLMLVVKNGKAQNYKITWGTETKTYTAQQLADGINLAADFAVNPFSDAFAKVDSAVAAKQAYETRQVKDLFHGPEGRVDMRLTTELTEETRAPLVAAIRAAFVPVTYTIRIEAAD
ncbi:MAG: SGNH/GDSL hydrolase family protein [Candidatus Omnitrophica bacterium]|nr:SGNH/GDSL hydrolase family protein [Candidatus Omnitrophota bacterium]